MSPSNGNGFADGHRPDPRQSLSQLLFRIWPYFPVVLLCLALAFGGAYYYLRKATPVYQAHAQIVVNDNSLDKDNNLNNRDTRLSNEAQVTETEKQVEIIQSKALLYDVVRDMKLYISWSRQGAAAGSQGQADMPVSLEISSPADITRAIEGDVLVLPNEQGVEFAGRRYQADTVLPSPMGLVRWHIFDRGAVDQGKLHLKLYPVSDAVSLLQERLLATPLSKQSPILDMTLTDEDPVRGEKVLRKIIEVYGERNMRQKKRVLDSTLNFIDQRLQLVAGDLKGVESSIQNYKSNQGITNLASEGQNFLQEVRDNDRKINEINIQLNVLDQIEQYLDKGNQSGGSVPATLGLSDQVLVSLLTQLFQDQYDLEKLRQLSGEKNPKVKLLEDRIAQHRSGIRQSVANLKKSLLTSRAGLETISSTYNRSLRAIPQKERVLVDITRDQSIKNDLYTFLLRKREEAAIAAAAIEPNYNVIEQAESTGLLKPKPVLIYLYSIVLAFLLSGLWVYFREFGSRKILYRHEIESRSHIPIIGEIVYDAAARKNAVVLEKESRTLIAEQFRELRANIGYKLHHLSSGKVILLTSSIPGEGKSFLSVNLAVSLARASRSTVLVEFDLYKPKVLENLQMESSKGITDYFLDEIDLDGICHPHESIPDLWVVSSGKALENPAELILNGKLPALMNYLKERFDYVVVDSPCIGMVSDTKILGPYANLSLYVIRQKITQKGFLEFANQLAKDGNMPNLYFVLNAVRVRMTLGLDYWDSYGRNGYRYSHKNAYTYYGKPGKKFRAYFSKRQ